MLPEQTTEIRFTVQESVSLTQCNVTFSLLSFQIVPKTLNPQWREQFDFHLYEERGGIIDITVWDKDAGKKDDFIGRFVQLQLPCSSGMRTDD